MDMRYPSGVQNVFSVLKYLGSCTDYPETSVALSIHKALISVPVCDSSPKLRTCDIVINAKGIWVVS